MTNLKNIDNRSIHYNNEAITKHKIGYFYYILILLYCMFVRLGSNEQLWSSILHFINRHSIV